MEARVVLGAAKQLLLLVYLPNWIDNAYPALEKGGTADFFYVIWVYGHGLLMVFSVTAESECLQRML